MSAAYTPRQQRLLDEHQYDTCDHEPGGSCPGGCGPYCISDRHKGDRAPDWPCNVARPILGVRTAQEFWDREAEQWVAWAEAHPEWFA